MQRNKMTRRKFLQGVAITSFGVVGAQMMAACTVPAPTTAGDASSATESSAAPAATDVTLRVQVPPPTLSVMPTILGERFQADTGIQVVIEDTLYMEVETKNQNLWMSKITIQADGIRPTRRIRLIEHPHNMPTIFGHVIEKFLLASLADFTSPIVFLHN